VVSDHIAGSDRTADLDRTVVSEVAVFTTASSAPAVVSDTADILRVLAIVDLEVVASVVDLVAFTTSTDAKMVRGSLTGRFASPAPPFLQQQVRQFDLPSGQNGSR
jgi:hypothetical protein